MDISRYLAAQWRPALGCTEPACIALAAARASALAQGDVLSVSVVCDPRLYKNCHAVGIPHSGRRTGIRWAAALGSLRADPDAGLECFRGIDEVAIEGAARLLESRAVTVEIDRGRDRLYVSCEVAKTGGRGLAVIAGEHTRIVRLRRDGEDVPVAGRVAGHDAEDEAEDVPALAAALSFEDMIACAHALTVEDRGTLRSGVRLNVAIARHGLSLLPERFVDMAGEDPLTRLSRLVCAGVYARMCGEDFTVMSLAGSGNKGIVASVPLALYGEESGRDPARIDEALALACLVTSATTHHLGTLSAVCGCSNAAGIGLAAGLTLLEGGGAHDVSHAVTNMVGNVTGMICDGAKIGCALKTMTAVDAAFRSVSLALSGICIPYSDGIVGRGGEASLRNLGRIASPGMAAVDGEILAIMQSKMDAPDAE